MPQFTFEDGETLRTLRLHYVTFGPPVFDQRITPTGEAADAYFRSIVVPLAAHR